MLYPSPRLVALLATLAACGPDPGPATGVASEAASTTASTGEPPGTASGPDGVTTGPPPETTGPGTTGDPPPLVAECEQDSDCTLINSCCECDPKPVDAPLDPCPEECFAPLCDSMQKSNLKVACRSGICEFAPVPCSGVVTCDSPQPVCPPNTVSAFVGDCWGPCIEPRYCAEPGCQGDACGDGWVCVAHQATGGTCAPIPFECGGTATCACMAPYLDEFCPASCSDADGTVLCEDGG